MFSIVPLPAAQPFLKVPYPLLAQVDLHYTLIPHPHHLGDVALREHLELHLLPRCLYGIAALVEE